MRPDHTKVSAGQAGSTSWFKAPRRSACGGQPMNAQAHWSAENTKQRLTEEKIVMKAIVVTDQAAGTAGMKLGERPEPTAAINDVIVQIHASGFVPTELAWPSTWTDRRDRDRTPSIPG